ncbi:hypothetical protein SAMN02787142_0141 [Burkholderia sp. WP9]|nr:hypothetical protein SAMN02787142_0141 [Burkholderia sp. WP9]
MLPAASIRHSEQSAGVILVTVDTRLGLSRFEPVEIMSNVGRARRSEALSGFQACFPKLACHLGFGRKGVFTL